MSLKPSQDLLQVVQKSSSMDEHNPPVTRTLLTALSPWGGTARACGAELGTHLCNPGALAAVICHPHLTAVLQPRLALPPRRASSRIAQGLGMCLCQQHSV